MSAILGATFGGMMGNGQSKDLDLTANAENSAAARAETVLV